MRIRMRKQMKKLSMNADQEAIAREIGVSQATVSRVLGNSPRISAGTRQRVLRVANRLNYCPHGIAQMFSGRKQLFVGILARVLTGSFSAEVIDGAEKAVLGAGKIPLISVTNGSSEALEMYIRHYRQYRVSGCLALGFRGPEELCFLGQLRDSGIPVVSACADLTEPGYPSVFVREQEIASLAAGHLLQLGHTRIAYFGPEGRRRDFFVKQIPGSGVKKKWMVPSGNTADEGLAALGNLLGGADRPTAIFAYSDELAILCLKAAVRTGRHVPTDLSIMGVDDIPLASMVEPEITTVRQPKTEQGYEAYGLLNRIITGHNDVRQVVLRAELVPRRSTGPAKTGIV